MKKIFYLLALLICTSANAQKNIEVVWPFSVASTQAQMVRALIENANNTQKKYNFVFLHKPGAGGSIAALYVKEAKNTAILASTSSFYIRPKLFKDSHHVDDFSMISTFCENQPLAIFSKKIDNLNINNNGITIGVIPGSITTLVTRSISRENNHVKIIEIPYKGTPEATSDMLGGHIDGSVDFIGNSTMGRLGKDVRVVALTGNRSINGLNTFESLKIKGLTQITNDYFIFTRKTMDIELKNELTVLLSKVLLGNVAKFCEDDYGQIPKNTSFNLDNLHIANENRWKSITNGLPQE